VEKRLATDDVDIRDVDVDILIDDVDIGSYGLNCSGSSSASK
jgi:hypothetical protein